MTNKVWHLTKSLTLTLAPPSSRGYCFKCKLEKEISVISEKPFGLVWEERKFCHFCSLNNLYELEESDHKFANKRAVISEIREAVKNQPVIDDDNQQLECYG